MKSTFFIVLGVFFLILGMLGIFLPLLPSTPFLLLTAICFNRGSPRFHSWLIMHPWFGPPIQDWNERKAIRVQYKVIATAMFMGTALMVFPKEHIPLMGKVSYAVLALFVLTFLWTRKSR